MSIVEKTKNFLTKAQGWSDGKKKIVLWTIVAVLAIVMGFFWVRSAIDNFSKMSQSVNLENIK